MKSILTLSIVFLSGLSAFSQGSLPISFDAILKNTSNEKINVQEVQNLPYPIIFIHGLNSNDKTWSDLGNFLSNNYGLTFGGWENVCLNYDGDNSKANTNIYPIIDSDIAFYSNINTINIGDFYFVNFDINNQGQLYPHDNLYLDVLSNEAAIVKQGVALKYIIQMVLQKTGKDKVILMGHSMGGLASREYLQNPINWQSDGNHHVAKLVTTGTPHGGYTGTNVPTTGIDSSSEAYRDLRKEYTWSGYVGAYLYGGSENPINIDNSVFSDFYNVDVNCNGINGDNSLIVGLNQKKLPLTLDYAYIIGNCGNCVILQGSIEGDGIVRSVNANLNNFYTLPIPKNEFIYKADAIDFYIGLHSDLPKAIPVNMQGLDEPNELNLAYGIEFGKTYKGFTTVQPDGGYSDDFDDFTFNVISTSQVNVSIGNVALANLMAHIVDINGNSYGVVSSNGTNSISFSQTLPAGKYYI